MNKLFHKRNSGNPGACTSVPNSAQLKLDFCKLHLTCHAWFSFAMRFVRFSVLHNMSTVRWIISPTTTAKNSQVWMPKSAQRSWAAIPVIALDSPQIIVCHMLCQFSTLHVHGPTSIPQDQSTLALQFETTGQVFTVELPVCFPDRFPHCAWKHSQPTPSSFDQGCMLIKV